MILRLLFFSLIKCSLIVEWKSKVFCNSTLYKIGESQTINPYHLIFSIKSCRTAEETFGVLQVQFLCYSKILSENKWTNYISFYKHITIYEKSNFLMLLSFISDFESRIIMLCLLILSFSGHTKMIRYLHTVLFYI